MKNWFEDSDKKAINSRLGDEYLDLEKTNILKKLWKEKVKN